MMAKGTKKKNKTPLRAALRSDSDLLALVQDGLGAVKNKDRPCFDEGIRTDFADSLEIDESQRKGHEQDNRWDYILGHKPSGELVAVEPHSAKDDEITTVIKKRTAAKAALHNHLRDGKQIAKWLWVSSGDVRFANTEKAKLRLDQNGIEFVGKTVRAKHLPES